MLSAHEQTLTSPNVCAVQRPIEQSEGENFADEIVLFLHQEVPQDHTDTHQKLEKSGNIYITREKYKTENVPQISLFENTLTHHALD